MGEIEREVKSMINVFGLNKETQDSLQEAVCD